MNKVKKVFERVADAVFPKKITCISCNGELVNDEQSKFCLCEECKKELSYIGDKDHVLENEDLYFKIFLSIYTYNGVAKKLVIGFKDGNKPYLGEYIANFLFYVYNQKNLSADIITYVPASKNKKALRTYDHMKIVANNLSKLTKIKIVDALGRINKGMDQTESKDRYENIKGHYYFNKDCVVKDKNILLIDDVVTTGATASECSKILMQNGARSVTLLTFTEAKSFKDYKLSKAKRMEKHKP